jgi:hypothetical protein
MPAPMKKNFPLTAAGRNDARVRDKIRQEVNKYVRRERRKELPEGFTLLEFDCRVGANPAQAGAMALKEVAGAIDAVALAGATEVYVEIVGVPGQRKIRD